jgi:hypothetical protein
MARQTQPMSASEKGLFGSSVRQKAGGRLMARVRNRMSLWIPEGYQDETGFHFGSDPRNHTTTWPPMKAWWCKATNHGCQDINQCGM